MTSYGKTPEEYVLAQERYVCVLELFDKIKQILTNEEFRILWDFCINGKSQEEIAKKNNTYQQKISRILIKIKKKCVNVLDKKIYSEKLFKPPQSTLEAHGAKHKISYPHEYLQDISVNAYWKTQKNGKREFVSETKCKIPEYLSESFHDDLTMCPICITDWGDNLCTRR